MIIYKEHVAQQPKCDDNLTINNHTKHIDNGKHNWRNTTFHFEQINEQYRRRKCQKDVTTF